MAAMTSERSGGGASNSPSQSSSGAGLNLGCATGLVTSLLEMDENDNSFPWSLMHHNELAQMLNTGLTKTMVIDCRSFLEYNTSNIQQSVNVCCSKLVKRRLQQDKVHVIDLLHQTCNIGADATWDVVVYDQCTEDPSLLTPDNFVQVLLHKLAMAFNSVAFLKGGFLAFQASHPHMTENKSSSQRCSTLTSLSQPCMPVSNVGPTRILPFLYLGSQQDSLNQELAQVNGITYILNVSKTCPCPPYIQENHFYRIPVNDNYCEKLLPFFKGAFQFLDKVREANGCVLVHCLGGVSRSATLTIAYIMKHMRMSSDEAYRYVKDKRPTISPNFNFLGQLIEFEKILKQEAREEDARRRDLKRLPAVSMEETGITSPAVMDLKVTLCSSPAARLAPQLKLGANVTSTAVAPLPLDRPCSQAAARPEGLTSPPSPRLAQEAGAESPHDGSEKNGGLVLRQRRLAPSAGRPVSAPIPVSFALDQWHLPGPLKQHKQMLEAATKLDNEIVVSSETHSASIESVQSSVCPVIGFPSPGLPGDGCPLSTRPVTGFPGPGLPGDISPQSTRPVTGFPGPGLPGDISPQSTCPVTGFPGPGLPGDSSPQSTCPVTGFPGPGLPGDSSPQSTRPVTGFPGPGLPGDSSPQSTCPLTEVPGPVLDTDHQQCTADCLTSSIPDVSHPRVVHPLSTIPDIAHTSLFQMRRTELSLGDVPHSPREASLMSEQLATTPITPCVARDNSVTQCVIGDNSVTPHIEGDNSLATKYVLKEQQQHYQTSKKFSLSSMFSGFRWRSSRPPTLPLSSPVGSMKKHGGDGCVPDRRVQLTPVSEGAEHCDLNSPHEESRGDHINNISQTGSSSSNVNATCLTSTGVSLTSSSLSPGPSLPSPTSSLPMTEQAVGNDNFAISKPGSLRLRAKDFTLSLSSPTANFPVKFSPTSSSSVSPSYGLASPSDQPNKRKNFQPSSSISPDKLAKTDGHHPAAPPKTLNLAQSTMGKLKQRLSGRKTMVLPLSSPTAAMAKLNFASPSSEQPSTSLLVSTESSASGSQEAVLPSADMRLCGEEYKQSRKGKGHRKEGSKSLFLRKCRHIDDRSHAMSSSRATIGDRQKQHLNLSQVPSSLLASLSSPAQPASPWSSSSSSSMTSSKVCMSMSSSSYSDMSSSSNMSTSPPPQPAPIVSPAAATASASSSTSIPVHGLSQFPTTSLDKLSFTPCYVKDIVHDLKEREHQAGRRSSASIPNPSEEEDCNATANSSNSNNMAGPSALDSPMSISSGSSAPSLASSTLSPIEMNMSNPFSSGGSCGGMMVMMDDVMEQLTSSYSLPQSPDSQDYQRSVKCNPHGGLDPTSPSSMPQSTIAPTLPMTPSSSLYSCSSCFEPLSPMSLSDNSTASSPIRSPTQTQHDPTMSLSHPAMSLTHPTMSLPHPTMSSMEEVVSSSSCGASLTSSVTSPLSSISQLSSTSSTKVVLRRARAATGDRPNSIAFSHYPACDDLIAQPDEPIMTQYLASEAADCMESPSSLDDTSEPYLSSHNRRSLRHYTGRPQQSQHTPWGAYSEREVYRQITAAMESAMLRSQAYSRRAGSGSRKARSLDDIISKSRSGETTGLDFVSWRRLGTGSKPYSPRGGATSSRYAGAKDTSSFHCGLHGAGEPYQSNSSLSSNGSHSSSLEILQVS